MRGWEVLRFEELKGEPVGEIIRFMTNVEYRFPFYKSFGLNIFVDGGLLAEHTNNISHIPHSPIPSRRIRHQTFTKHTTHILYRSSVPIPSFRIRLFCLTKHRGHRRHFPHIPILSFWICYRRR